ncbi:MAG: hypothetical protein HC802_22390 [Caldilineaceae bacterium]|nr:hypothetical protein [Caldilineaceae bacterium]
MIDAMITIPVDTETARVYNETSSEAQRKIQLLLRLRLRELAGLSDNSLCDIMDEVGAKAEERGLTSELLDQLLGEE